MSKRYPGGIIRKTPQTPSQTSAQGIWDMASVTQAVKENNWPIAGVPDPISKSLRFRSSASAYLNRTPASAGNRQIWTWSGWVKRGALSSGSYMDLFTALTDGNNFTEIRFHFNTNDDTLVFTDVAGGTTYGTYSTNVYRDPSAWYHIVCSVDTTQATSTNRVKLYVNGVQVTQNAGGSGYPLQNTNTNINAAVEHRLGGIATYGRYFDGYMAEVNFIDGQALPPSAFGSLNDQTGVGQPIAYTGTYGTNGFYLPFSNTASTATLGNDFSGNSNNWTTNNISLTSGSTYDSMVDVPTQWIPYNTAGDTGGLWRGNYCVLNPLTPVKASILNANLTVNAGNRYSIATIGMSSGKWYAEMTVTTAGTESSCGIATQPDVVGSYVGNNTNSWGYYNSNGEKYNNSIGVTYGATYTTGDVIGIAFDADVGTLTFYKNNVSQGTAFTGLTSGPYYFAISGRTSGTPNNCSINFGQQPFVYTPPSGFKTLCTTNLPTPTIGATAATTANKYFDATIWTGDNTTPRSITNSGSMQPDFVWLKSRSNAYQHNLYDAVRGAGSAYALSSDSTAAEGGNSNVYGFLSAFNSTGFQVTQGTAGSGGAPNGNAYTNQTSTTYVGWQWRASNATAVTNTAGSITSTVSANTTAGFSIVTWTGSGSNSDQTVGTGLSTALDFIITKPRTANVGTDSWLVYTSAITLNQNECLILNSTSAKITTADQGTPSRAATAGQLKLFAGTLAGLNNQNMNASGVNYVAYCFHAVAGYSAFGSYTGNGSSDGTFVFTGFRPRYVMIKRTNTTGDWIVYDSARSTYNGITSEIYPNLSNAEDNSSVDLDFVSNGIKLRNSGSGVNASGDTYIYACFAESPFKYALAR